MIDCPDNAFAPAFPLGTVVELQARGPEDATYLWTLDGAPEGGEGALQPSEQRRALIALEALGDYSVCYASGEVSAGGCCIVHAVGDLRVEQLTRDGLRRISDILSIGSTTAADDAEADGHFVLWLQVNQDVEVDVSFDVPDGVRVPRQVSAQRYVGSGSGILALLAFYAAPDPSLTGRPPADGDRVVWRVALMPLVAGEPRLLEIQLVLAPRAEDPGAPRIVDAALALDEEGWRIDLLDVGVASITWIDAGGWDIAPLHVSFNGGVARLDGGVELASGQRIALRPWSMTTTPRAGVAFHLVVP